MSKEIAVEISSLSKTYNLYHHQRDRIKEILSRSRKSYHIRYQALSGINLSVYKGEVIGIIGQNGSGKSTLLKILASVVTPSSGTYLCKGRVTALLELGGGFNKEITGVENIYFLGGIQGYSKKEMQQRLHEILEFADVGVYADQPINNYSSGMYVRLAFSMAVNINPDILIIDEALAVGDIRFQQKCFRKIREFKEAGKTIIFCSHNLSAVRDFCTKAVWLHQGRIIEQGDPIFVTDRFNSFMTTNDSSLLIKKQITDKKEYHLGLIHEDGLKKAQVINWDAVDQHESYGIGGGIIKQVAIYSITTQSKISALKGGEYVRVYIDLIAFQKFENPGISIVLNGRTGLPVFKISSYVLGQRISLEISKPCVLAIDFQFPILGNGRYTLSIGLLNVIKDVYSEIHWIHDVIGMEVNNPDDNFKQGTVLVIEKATIECYS